MIPVKVTRPYVMRARAASAEATRQQILDAAVAEIWCRRMTEVRLEDIASRAELTVQTVLRVFGSRARLLDAAWEVTVTRVRKQRGAATPGDVAGTVHALYDHYEEMGDFVVRNLADEARVPGLRATLEWGRREHRKAMRRQFASWLDAREPGDRRALLDCLVAACDVYVWKLLRRDLGRSRSDAEARVRRIVSGILEGV
jgi:AcrR family transcriptional regulator